MTIRKNFVRVHVVKKTANGFENVADILNNSKSIEKALKETRKNPDFKGCLVYGEKVNVTFNLDIVKAIAENIATVIEEKPVEDETEETEDTED